MHQSKIRIHNCHTHLFTLDHLPEKFFPGFSLITRLIRNDIAREIIIFLAEILLAPVLRTALPNFPRLSRVSSFLQICENRSQHDVFFNSLQRYYPEDTRYIVLPMDYSFMGYGSPIVPIEKQLEELASVRDTFPKQIIPFVHIDPRHEGASEKIKYWITDRDFRGVKIYPPFGYSPDDPKLDPIYAFCESHGNGIPIMTHCSGATLRRKKLSKKEANKHCSPEHYKTVLTSFPDLRLCLGHFGGDRAWESYWKKPLYKDRIDRKDPEFSGTENWLHTIINMLESGSYDNLFVDISYVIFHYQDNSNILKVLLANPRIRRSVLFGTDYYMVEIEKFSEKKLSMYLRAQIGEEYYKQIAETNPRRYLFGDDHADAGDPAD